MHTAIDKRKHTRISAHVLVRCKDIKDLTGEKAFNVISIDLGLGGVRFRSGRFIPRSSRLIIEISLPHLDRPIKAITRLAWIHKSRSGEDYEAASQFLEMTPESRFILAGYLARD